MCGVTQLRSGRTVRANLGRNYQEGECRSIQVKLDNWSAEAGEGKLNNHDIVEVVARSGTN
jgi:hypothetical protein